ncbi:MAG: DUF5947 family protein [Phycisphaeraceae bacterium]
MPPPPTTTAQSTWPALRRFLRPRPTVERCELCSEPLATAHAHLVEPTTRRILCACDACAVLFDNETRTRYRRVPRDARSVPGFSLSDVQWTALGIPIGLAFFFHSTPAERVVAIYPSPAGPTETLLERDAWHTLARNHPTLNALRPDVEALLVNRVSRTHRYHVAPIDKCYELVGLIRTHWRGLSGGDELWQHVERFFTDLDQRARPAREPSHA